MSLDTVVSQPMIHPELLSAFSQDEFNSHVMTTYGRFDLALAKGEGCTVWDTDGKAYLDFVAGIATCTLGHAHPSGDSGSTGTNSDVDACFQSLLRSLYRAS